MWSITNIKESNVLLNYWKINFKISGRLQESILGQRDLANKNPAYDFLVLHMMERVF